MWSIPHPFLFDWPRRKGNPTLRTHRNCSWRVDGCYNLLFKQEIGRQNLVGGIHVSHPPLPFSRTFCWWMVCSKLHDSCERVFGLFVNTWTLDSLPSHEFEEIYGETRKVYNIGIKYVEQTPEATRDLLWSERFLTSADQAGDGEVVLVPVQTFWSEKKLPFALLKPFGYSAGRTELQIGCFWSWLVLGVVLHAWKYISSKKILEAQELAEAERAHPSMVKSLGKQHTDVTAFVDEENASGSSDDRHEEEELEA